MLVFYPILSHSIFPVTQTDRQTRSFLSETSGRNRAAHCSAGDSAKCLITSRASLFFAGKVCRQNAEWERQRHNTTDKTEREIRSTLELHWLLHYGYFWCCWCCGRILIIKEREREKVNEWNISIFALSLLFLSFSKSPPSDRLWLCVCVYCPCLVRVFY